MYNPSIILIIIIVSVLIYFYYHSPENFVTIDINGTYYKVHANFKDPIKAAKILDKLNSKIHKLFKYIKIEGDGKYTDSRLLFQRYNVDNLYENSPHNLEGTSSYVLQKGIKIAICLRKNNGQFYDENLITFVTLHELAHLFCRAFGHPHYYWRRFKYLLFKAAEIGIYKPVDYSKYPTIYHNITINFNPMFTSTI